MEILEIRHQSDLLLQPELAAQWRPPPRACPIATRIVIIFVTKSRWLRTSVNTRVHLPIREFDPM